MFFFLRASDIDAKAQMETVSKAVDKVVTKIAEIPYFIAGENPYPESEEVSKSVKFVSAPSLSLSLCVCVCFMLLCLWVQSSGSEAYGCS